MTSNNLPNPSIGSDIRERLIEAGSKGLVIADIFKDMKGKQTNATYCSFARYCWLFKKLGFTEATGKTEAASNPGLVRDRVYFSMTAKGKAVPIREWSNPMRTLFDNVHGEGAWVEYMREKRRPTGRPRGRPRKERCNY